VSLTSQFQIGFFVTTPSASSSNQSIAEVELSLRAGARDGYLADLRLRPPDSRVDTGLAVDVPVDLDFAALRAVSQDMQAYGRKLTDLVFAPQQLREAWATLHGYLEHSGQALRLRLRFDSGDATLHHIYWELLRDPLKGYDLCRTEKILFSRYLDSDGLAAVRSITASDIRVLVAIARPRNLAALGLGDIDAEGEAARIHEAAEGYHVDDLIRRPGGLAVTRENLFAAMSRGYHVLYLVCHGKLVQGTPQLYLEDKAGTMQPLGGDELVAHVQSMRAERRPVMIVLASCRSTGSGYESDVLEALGPKLARAGIGAVLGMQGDVPMTTVAELMPHLFSQLRAHGEIDRALAYARTHIDRKEPWKFQVSFSSQTLDADLTVDNGGSSMPISRLTMAAARSATRMWCSTPTSSRMCGSTSRLRRSMSPRCRRSTGPILRTRRTQGSTRCRRWRI